jgi:chemotaxis protein methyltransferase CheR
MDAASLGDREFSLIQGLLYSEAGIFLSDAKRTLVVSRLVRRLRGLGLQSFREYWERVQTDREERRNAIEAICTHETSFFREPGHFRFLEEHLAPRLRAEAERGERAAQARVWSAGCSSGEEPFSIAMTLLHGLPAFSVEVLATDLSTQVLARARAATFSAEKARDIPAPLLKSYMLRGTGTEMGRMRASQRLRDHVRFAQLNLNDAHLAVPGGFDAIFCRNVLIYFDEASRKRAVDALIERLAPGGHLFVGHAETLAGWNKLRCVLPTVYCLRT